MVDNPYVMERLARDRYEEQLRMADQRRLQRSATEAPRPVQSGDLTAWLVTGSRSNPTPRRA
jgi:hypothetical protein